MGEPQEVLIGFISFFVRQGIAIYEHAIRSQAGFESRERDLRGIYFAGDWIRGRGWIRVGGRGSGHTGFFG
jgi:hypothetical protein